MPASRKTIVRRVACLSLAALFALFALGSIAAQADVPDWADCHATSSCDSTTTTVAPDTTTTTVAPDTTTTTVAPDTTTQATTTTTTTTTTTAPPVSCSGVSVSPSSNVQNVLNAYGTGTTFCFQPGTYVLTGFIVPKSYDRLISVVPRGAVFTGLDTYNAGVHGYGGSTGQHDVLFQGFVVTHMANSMSTSPNAALSAGDNSGHGERRGLLQRPDRCRAEQWRRVDWQFRAPQRPVRLRRRADHQRAGHQQRDQLQQHHATTTSTTPAAPRSSRARM